MWKSALTNVANSHSQLSLTSEGSNQMPYFIKLFILQNSFNSSLHNLLTDTNISNSAKKEFEILQTHLL